MKARIAVLDDEARMAEVLRMVLSRDGHEVHSFTEPKAMLAAFDDEPFDLLLSDIRMPGMDGTAVLAEVKKRTPHVPVLLMTAYATVKTALTAMKQGAEDYLLKPLDNELVRSQVRRALERTRLERENRALRAELRGKYGLDRVVAVSKAMTDVLEPAMRAARARSTVLISGESGTGKEVTARLIHVHSERCGEPFIAVNCKAFAESLLESELFGHAKGAFTGADSAKAGVFERAHGGTLFLDEIGEVNESFQAKLLRVLQEREVLRVGGSEPRPVDVRVLAATNKDLEQEVRDGNFREDLYYRLAVIPIRIPPLRERRADILPLARGFLSRMNGELNRSLEGWTQELEDWMLHHDWPGNVRQLENSIERGAVLARGERIELSDVVLGSGGNLSGGATGESSAAGATLQEHLDQAAAEHIRAALQACDGVRVDAARMLGVERTTLYRLMKRFGVMDA